jgi:hypothetical protein
MKRTLISFLLSLVVAGTAFGQGHSFQYGEITLRDLNMTVYPYDSTAPAVVLREFGEGYLDGPVNEADKIIFDYHVLIKILSKDGLDKADFVIPLTEYNGREEVLRSVEATSYNLIDHRIVPTKLEQRNIYTENVENNRVKLKKFAVPNVQVGSIVEVHYVLESPWVYNFRTWMFQSDIPKVKSEFWATYPANYEYNITLRGFQNLDLNESNILRLCVGSARGLAPTAGADCLQRKFAMNNIPAFRDEEYMTARTNFISAIYFELSIYKGFDGVTRKFTREWKDVDQDLQRSERFGIQLRKGKGIVEDDVKRITFGETDPLLKAKKIFAHIQSSVSWNTRYGYWTDLGVKQAYETKKGNVGDINLLLVGALQSAGIDAAPVLASTRNHGLPVKVHPELSSFNYVIALATINDKKYFLDATEPYFVFGMLPERCINGQGRVMPGKDSYWIDLNPTHKDRQTFVLNLKLDKDGSITGLFQNNYSGYAGMYMRKKILSHVSREEYLKDLRKEIGDGAEIDNYTVKGLDTPEESLIESFNVRIKLFEGMDQFPLLLNPFFIGKLESTPFKSKERLYPVDFGAPLEETVVLTLEYPDDLKLSEVPPPLALTLPAGGGRYLQEMRSHGNKFTMSSAFTIAKTVYTSEEYHYLKELYSRLIAAQNSDIVFEKNKP